MNTDDCHHTLFIKYSIGFENMTENITNFFGISFTVCCFSIVLAQCCQMLAVFAVEKSKKLKNKSLTVLDQTIDI